MFIYFWNYAASIVITCKSVSKRSSSFVIVITQIRTFSLNLGTFNKNYETSKYFLGRSFEKYRVLTLSANPQNGKTHSSNSSAKADELFERVWTFCESLARKRLRRTKMGLGQRVKLSPINVDSNDTKW